MKKTLPLILTLLTLLLAACGSTSATPELAPVDIGTTGQPQLIEFYADW